MVAGRGRNLEGLREPFVPQNLTTTERDAIVSPPTGVIIWNTTTARLERFDGTSWAEVNTGWTRIGSISILAAATQAAAEFTAGITSAFRFYKLLFWAVPVTDNVELMLRVSTDGGVSFLSGASDYRWANQFATDQAGGGSLGDIADTEIELVSSSTGSAAGEGMAGEIIFFDPLDTRLSKRFLWQLSQENLNGQQNTYQGAGQLQAVTAIDAVQIAFSSGDIEDGEFVLYGAN